MVTAHVHINSATSVLTFHLVSLQWVRGGCRSEHSIPHLLPHLLIPNYICSIHAKPRWPPWRQPLTYCHWVIQQTLNNASQKQWWKMPPQLPLQTAAGHGGHGGGISLSHTHPHPLRLSSSPEEVRLMLASFRHLCTGSENWSNWEQLLHHPSLCSNMTSLSSHMTQQ